MLPSSVLHQTRNKYLIHCAKHQDATGSWLVTILYNLKSG